MTGYKAWEGGGLRYLGFYAFCYCDVELAFCFGQIRIHIIEEFPERNGN